MASASGFNHCGISTFGPVDCRDSLFYREPWRPLVSSHEILYAIECTKPWLSHSAITAHSDFLPYPFGSYCDGAEIHAHAVNNGAVSLQMAWPGAEITLYNEVRGTLREEEAVYGASITNYATALPELGGGKINSRQREFA